MKKQTKEELLKEQNELLKELIRGIDDVKHMRFKEWKPE